MQHKFGKPLHRSTKWRRERKGRQSRRGRRWVSEYKDRGFLGFAAGIVSIINQNGSVGYGQLFQRKKSLHGLYERSYWEDESTASIFEKLAKSGFPAPMIAVAACHISALNYQIRPNAKLRHLTPSQQAFFERWQSGDGKTQEHEDFDFDAIDRSLGLKEPAAQTKPADVPKPSKIIMSRRKGTTAHQVHFLHGAKLTRQMASYWRRHRSYKACGLFLLSLLTCDFPGEPCAEFSSVPDPNVSGQFLGRLKVRRMERTLARG